MKTQKQTINEMIAQIIAEARKLGYSEATIWRNITPKFQTVALPLLPSKEKHLRQEDGQADQDHGRVGPGGI